MKVIISGCRDFTDTDFIYAALYKYLPSNTTEILVGDATGVDAVVRNLCCHADVYPSIYYANWTKHGKAAGPMRNALMAEKGDLLIAFWDYQSSGTGNMISQMVKLKKDYIVIECDQTEVVKATLYSYSTETEKYETTPVADCLNHVSAY